MCDESEIRSRLKFGGNLVVLHLISDNYVWHLSGFCIERYIFAERNRPEYDQTQNFRRMRRDAHCGRCGADGLGSVPLEVTALGRLIPSWDIDDTGITGVLPPASAKRSDAVSPLTLVPMGAARLRISAFPTSEK